MSKVYDAVELKAFGETFLADPILKMSFNAVLRNAPAVEAEPVVHGRWISQYSSLGQCLYYHCSECGESEPRQGTMRKQAPYCPNCGAKMDLK